MSTKVPPLIKEAFSLVKERTGKDIAQKVLDAYTSKDRYYHGLGHITELLERAEVREDCTLDLSLTLAILYHDIVYDAALKDNEERSAMEFLNDFEGVLSDEELFEISKAIRETLHHKPSSELSRQLCDLDMEPIFLADYDLLVKNNALIRKEYHMYSDKEFFFGVLKFFEPYKDLSEDHRRYYNEYLKGKFKEASIT